MINPLLRYKTYHTEKINIIIHQICIPILLITFYSLVSLKLSIIINLFYSINFLLFDLLSKKSINSIIYLQIIYFIHFLFRNYFSSKINIIIHIIGWVLQIIGHKFYEGNSPALIDNLYDSLLFGPYFTYLETFYPSSFKNYNKYTIINNNYDNNKKSIIYFPGLFQRSDKIYNELSKSLPSYNHIFVNINFKNCDKFYKNLENLSNELKDFDIECLVGFSFGGSLALQLKNIYKNNLKKNINTILVSPGGFSSKTFLEKTIKYVSKKLYYLYSNDKWYMIKNYPEYQNRNLLFFDHQKIKII